jgi:hypothetical protein
MYNQIFSDYKNKYTSKIDNQIGGQIGGQIGTILILGPEKNFKAQYNTMNTSLKIKTEEHKWKLDILNHKQPDNLKSLTIFVTKTGSVVVIIAKPDYGHTSIGYNNPPINSGLLNEKDNHLF